MGLNDLLNIRKALARTMLLISFLLVQSCSNDERLEGYRLSVLEEQKFYETNKKNYHIRTRRASSAGVGEGGELRKSLVPPPCGGGNPGLGPPCVPAAGRWGRGLVTNCRCYKDLKISLFNI